MDFSGWVLTLYRRIHTRLRQYSDAGGTALPVALDAYFDVSIRTLRTGFTGRITHPVSALYRLHVTRPKYHSRWCCYHHLQLKPARHYLQYRLPCGLNVDRAYVLLATTYCRVFAIPVCIVCLSSSPPLLLPSFLLLSSSTVTNWTLPAEHRGANCSIQVRCSPQRGHPRHCYSPTRNVSDATLPHQRCPPRRGAPLTIQASPENTHP